VTTATSTARRVRRPVQRQAESVRDDSLSHPNDVGVRAAADATLPRAGQVQAGGRHADRRVARDEAHSPIRQSGWQQDRVSD